MNIHHITHQKAASIMSNPAKTVTPEWLASHLEDPTIKIIDASWYMPGTEKNADEIYEKGHIPGAVQFEIDAIEMPGTGLPHMLASEEDFASAVGKLGIRETDTIVIYDGMGMFMAASRVWYNFVIMGAKDVRILSGGMPGWNKLNLPIEEGRFTPEPVKFNASFDQSRVKSIDDIRQAIADGDVQILDARASERFNGEVPESNPELKNGHMPGALNAPFSQLLELGEFKNPDELRAIFDNAGVDLGKPIITTCGSGVTACVINFALDILDHDNHSMYDGSWTEWGGAENAEVVKGGND
jgi:thiosulfate/3-mercaptopyruvate sulfurtransferase